MFSKDALALLPGNRAVDRFGRRIGRVRDVYVADCDPAGFASVSGPFGTRSALAPLDRATLDGRTLRVPYSRDEVRAAPGVAVDAELSHVDAERLHEHYRRTGTPEEGAGRGPGTVDVVVTVTAGGDGVLGDPETVVGAASEAVRGLVAQTTAELRADPDRDRCTAVLRIGPGGTGDPDGPADHQRSTTPATGGSDSSVA